ncbi:MAG: AAA family ATPase, partial [Pseudopedobacter saltans]
MELNAQVRQKIREALIANRVNFEGSDAKYASSFDINSGVYNRIKKGETERVMRDAKWISIARRLNVLLGDEPEWMPAKTAIFDYITTQLSLCQRESICGLYCDKADIGK